MDLLLTKRTKLLQVLFYNSNDIEVSSALASMTLALGFFEDIFRMRGDKQLGIAIRACHEARIPSNTS